jgi:hypothetical protein
MNNTKYIFIDAEMGGRELKFSLLTSHFAIVDFNFNIIDELSLITKPDDDVYIVSGQGMSVNKINLVDHDKIAIPYKQAKTILYNFLSSNSDHGKCRLTPVGHGVKGDILFFQNYIISKGSWEQFCTYHYIDTSVVLQFLRLCGKMPFDTNGNVESLAKLFGINVDESQLHTASYDVHMIIEIFKSMKNLVI